MKKKIILTVLAAVLTILSYGQEAISGFYGLKFGMTTEQVRTALQSKGNTLDSPKEDKGLYSYKVKGVVNLSGIRFDGLTLRFQNDKLVKGSFSSMDGAGGNPNNTAVYQRVANSANDYANKYMSLKTSLLSKYGDPTTTQETNTKHNSIWIKNGNRIKLEYLYEDYYDGPYMRQAAAGLLIEYSSSTFNIQDTQDL